LPKVRVIADPVRWRLWPRLLEYRPRTCQWAEYLAALGVADVETVSVADLERTYNVVRLQGRGTDWTGLVIVAWDSANGDAACGSDRTLAFFRDNGLVRLNQLMTFQSILLCEAQTAARVPLQAAYDAIFGPGEVTVVSSAGAPDQDGVRRGPWGDWVRRQGWSLRHPVISLLISHHPLLDDMSRRVRGERTYRGPLFNLRNRPSDEEGTDHILWRGWFTEWRRGWLPLVFADDPHRGTSFRRPVLLAKPYRHGLLLASTLWIAFGNFDQLMSAVLKLIQPTNDWRRLRRIHLAVEIVRGITDVLTLVAIGFLLLIGTIVLWRSVGLSSPGWLNNVLDALHFPNPGPVAQFAATLGIGVIGAAGIGWAWFRRCVWDRPFGYTVLRATMQWIPFGDSIVGVIRRVPWLRRWLSD
jgi:hypothetical protein